MKDEKSLALLEKIDEYEKEIKSLKEENRINKNKIDTQNKQILDLKDTIKKKDEIKITSDNKKRSDTDNKDESNNIKSKYLNNKIIEENKEKEQEINRLKRKVNKLILT